MAGSWKMVFYIILVVFCMFQVVPTIEGIRECAPPGENCALPDCLCPDWNPPAGLAATEVPQIVFLTFVGGITISNFPIYEYMRLTSQYKRQNPNGASVTSTFFITHEYNDYQLTHSVFRHGNEIALNSITHKSGTDYWINLNETEWAAEVCDQKAQIEHFAKLPTDHIQGFRAPFLQLGGEPQFRAISDPSCDLTYDSSRPTRTYSGPNPAKLWPYSMNFDTAFQDCQNGPCPTDSYPGFWTVPLVSLYGNNAFPCATVDTCLPTPITRNETFDLLKVNFLRHYNTSTIGNRAPFGVHTQAAWLQGEAATERLHGYNDFLDYLQTFPDVFIVSIQKGLEWMQNPVPLSDIDSFTPWLDEPEKPNLCTFGFSCQYNDVPPGGQRYMQSCQVCPRSYPWIHNPLGTL